MQQQLEIEYRQRRAYELVTIIESLNTSITRLKDQKEAFEQELVDIMEHNYDGQKTYTLWDKRLVVKTPTYYRVNKALYLSGDIELPEHYNPVVAKIDYEIDKNKYLKIVESAPMPIVELLDKLIIESYGKKSVTIESRGA